MEFEDGIAAVNLLPGPASTQLAIYCAWRLGGPWGAIVGGACFIGPGLVLILALSALFLGAQPPRWVMGAAAGAGAAVPAVALDAAATLMPASWQRAADTPAERGRWFAYLLAGGPRFGQIRASASAQAFLRGAGPAAIGAIAGASIPLALSLSQAWQLAVLGAAIAWLVVRRHGVVSVLVLAGLLGVAAALAGLPPSR